MVVSAAMLSFVGNGAEVKLPPTHRTHQQRAVTSITDNDRNWDSRFKGNGNRPFSRSNSETTTACLYYETDVHSLVYSRPYDSIIPSATPIDRCYFFRHWNITIVGPFDYEYNRSYRSWWCMFKNGSSCRSFNRILIFDILKFWMIEKWNYFICWDLDWPKERMRARYLARIPLTPIFGFLIRLIRSQTLESQIEETNEQGKTKLF